MRHYWLEKAGIHGYPENNWGERGFLRGLKRSWRAWRTRRRTGVDPRDCYSMDIAFYQWLYEHLCQLVHDAENICDINYHRFLHDGKEYSEKEYIEYLKALLLRIMNFDSDPESKDCSLEGEDDCCRVRYLNELERNTENFNILRKEMLEVFSDLLPFLWW